MLGQQQQQQPQQQPQQQQLQLQTQGSPKTSRFKRVNIQSHSLSSPSSSLTNTATESKTDMSIKSDVSPFPVSSLSNMNEASSFSLSSNNTLDEFGSNSLIPSNVLSSPFKVDSTPLKNKVAATPLFLSPFQNTSHTLTNQPLHPVFALSSSSSKSLSNNYDNHLSQPLFNTDSESLATSSNALSMPPPPSPFQSSSSSSITTARLSHSSEKDGDMSMFDGDSISSLEITNHSPNLIHENNFNDNENNNNGNNSKHSSHRITNNKFSVYGNSPSYCNSKKSLHKRSGTAFSEPDPVSYLPHSPNRHEHYLPRRQQHLKHQQIQQDQREKENIYSKHSYSTLSSPISTLPTPNATSISSISSSTQKKAMDYDSNNISSISTIPKASSETTFGPSEFLTPQSKLVKPVASAFHSTGFLSKKNRPRASSAQPTPETPSKKLPLAFVFGANNASISHSSAVNSGADVVKIVDGNGHGVDGNHESNNNTQHTNEQKETLPMSFSTFTIPTSTSFTSSSPFVSKHSNAFLSLHNTSAIKPSSLPVREDNIPPPTPTRHPANSSLLSSGFMFSASHPSSERHHQYQNDAPTLFSSSSNSSSSSSVTTLPVNPKKYRSPLHESPLKNSKKPHLIGDNLDGDIMKIGPSEDFHLRPLSSRKSFDIENQYHSCPINQHTHDAETARMGRANYERKNSFDFENNVINQSELVEFDSCSSLSSPIKKNTLPLVPPTPSYHGSLQIFNESEPRSPWPSSCHSNHSNSSISDHENSFIPSPSCKPPPLSISQHRTLHRVRSTSSPTFSSPIASSSFPSLNFEAATPPSSKSFIPHPQMDSPSPFTGLLFTAQSHPLPPPPPPLPLPRRDDPSSDNHDPFCIPSYSSSSMDHNSINTMSSSSHNDVEDSMDCDLNNHDQPSDDAASSLIHDPPNSNRNRDKHTSAALLKYPSLDQIDPITLYPRFLTAQYFRDLRLHPGQHQKEGIYIWKVSNEIIY